MKVSIQRWDSVLVDGQSRPAIHIEPTLMLQDEFKIHIENTNSIYDTEHDVRVYDNPFDSRYSLLVLIHTNWNGYPIDNGFFNASDIEKSQSIYIPMQTITTSSLFVLLIIFGGLYNLFK